MTVVLMAIIAGILIVAAVVEAIAKSAVRALAFGALAVYFLVQVGALWG